MNSILSATVLIPLIVIVLLIVLLCVGYVKAPPDMAYIISGVKKKSKVVIGKASIRIPFFERLDKLNLRLIPIDVKTSNAVPTADYININVDGGTPKSTDLLLVKGGTPFTTDYDKYIAGTSHTI